MTATETAQSILREAAGCLDSVQLMRLARKWGRLRADAGPLLPQARRLSLLCDATSETYAPLLDVCAAARGLRLEIEQAPFGAWRQQILDPESAWHSSRPDLTLLHLTTSQFNCWPVLDCTHADAEKAARLEASQILGWCERIHRRWPVPVYLTNFHVPPHDPLGNLAGCHPGAASLHVQRVNLALAASAPAYVTLVDVAGLAARFGVHRWADPTAWYHARQPLAYDAMPVFVQSLAALIASACLGAPKCILLDLDNTLWGGEIADDGLEGIRLGAGDAQGEAHQDFQRHLLALRRRGILLAVCSKNDEKIAREVFEKHGQMLIKLADLSAFKANFSPKADNARAVARELNIGTDALVFVDDNPVEREQMRQFAPEVRIVDLPSDPSFYIQALEQTFFFQTPAITPEDLHRAGSYAANQQRAELAKQVTNIQEFLRSLEMRANLSPYLPAHLARITQLINKSNQFNLCTRRYSQEEIESIAKDPASITLSVRLQDRFGDNGLICAIHGRVREQTFHIENWVMSCRVLDRGVEQSALNHLVEAARRRGCAVIRGNYIPTLKNGLVREHFQRLNFHLVNSAPDGSTDWKLDIASFTPSSPPIQVLI